MGSLSETESAGIPVKAWRVLHACEQTRRVIATMEAETSVGMNPQILSREYWSGSVQAELSLLTTWNDVRDWRHALNEVEAVNSLHIVHAHSFASAMAGVRGNIPLVYDFTETLEETAGHSPNTGPWLLRSFRVAEQFVLSRAAAVVARSASMRSVSTERGAMAANVFLIPESGKPPEVLGRMYHDVYRHAYARRTDQLPRIPLPKLYALGTT